MAQRTYLKNTDMTLGQLEAHLSNSADGPRNYVPRKGTSTGLVNHQYGRLTTTSLSDPAAARFVIPVRTTYEVDDKFDMLQVTWVHEYGGRYIHRTKQYPDTSVAEVWEVAADAKGETDFVTIHAVHGPNLSLLDARP